jgi:hypothetical protein
MKIFLFDIDILADFLADITILVKFLSRYNDIEN